MSITKKIARRVANYQDTNSLGGRFRTKRITPLLGMIEEVFLERGRVTIIDVGGTEVYWRIIPRKFLIKHKVTITCVNLPGTITSTEDEIFRFVEGDGCNLKGTIGDNFFDIAHSNSTIEHVGDWGRMVAFAREIRRIASKYFVQVPNFWFPIEPHCMTPFFHWLPKPIRVSLVLKFQLGHWKRANSVDEAVRIVESARLLDKKMFKALFPEADIYVERVLGLPKSFLALKR